MSALTPCQDPSLDQWQSCILGFPFNISMVNFSVTYLMLSFLKNGIPTFRALRKSNPPKVLRASLDRWCLKYFHFCASWIITWSATAHARWSQPWTITLLAEETILTTVQSWWRKVRKLHGIYEQDNKCGGRRLIVCIRWILLVPRVWLRETRILSYVHIFLPA